MAKQYINDGGPDGAVFGQTSSDLIGFYGATPIARPATVTDATDATTAIAAVNTVIDRLQALGLIA
jgi:hypothetical protein